MLPSEHAQSTRHQDSRPAPMGKAGSLTRVDVATFVTFRGF